jgi:hypothetical protein
MSAPEMTEQLSAALAAQARGWYPFPVDHPSSPNCMGTACIRAIREEADKARQEGRRADYVRNVTCQPGQHDKRGKHPVGRWSTMTAAVQGEKMLALWFGDSARPANIGIACKPSGLVVLDEDKLAALQLLAAELGHEIPHTYRVRTARGWHYYFRAPTHVQLGNRSGRLKAHGIDVRGGRGDGGYVLGHGSVHATGVIYTAEDVDAEPAELPDWLIAEIMDVGSTADATPGVSAPTAAPGVAARQPTGSGGVWGDGGGGSSGAPRARPGDADWNGWDSEVRFGTAEQLREQYERHCDAVLSLRGAGGDCGFRFAFYIAARDGWRLYRLGLLGESELYATLRELIAVVWDAEPDAGDKAIVKDALSGPTGADASPWQLLTPGVSSEPPNERSQAQVPQSQTANHDVTIQDLPSSPQKKEVDLELNSVTDGSQADGGPQLNGHASASAFGSANSDGVSESVTPEQIAEQARARAYEAEVAAEIRRADIREEAAQRRRQRDQPPLAALDLAAFLTAPQPEYLVPGAFYRNSLGKVFGGPGSTKSFLMIDLALSLATGTPWFGQALEQARVHYVMAEGQAVNTRRALAWFADRGVEQPGPEWFTAIPQGVLLTEVGIAEYIELVRRERPALIILDTKNRMMVGEENSASDNGVMIRAMDALRQAADGACVVLVDHTGLMDPTRGRGSNAVEAAMDTEIRVARDEQGLITAEVSRDKDAEDGRRWTYRLATVELDGVWGDSSARSAVVRPVIEADTSPFVDRGGHWWAAEVELPDVIAALPSTVAGDLAREFFRILTFAREHETGVTQAFLQRAVSERPSGRGMPAEATARRARTTLHELGVLQNVTANRYALAPEYQTNQTLGGPKLISSEPSSQDRSDEGRDEVV